MGLIVNEVIDDQDHLVIWQCDESLEEMENLFFSKVKDNGNYDHYHDIKLDKRKKHWLATRLSLRSITKEDPNIAYDEHGAPWIEIDGWEISISHSGNWVAVLLSKRSMLGVDLQEHNGKISNIAKKFSHPIEFANWEKNKSEDYLHALWTIKESVYKAFKHSQPFKQIRVIPTWPFKSHLIACEINRKGKRYEVVVNHLKRGNFYLSYVRL